MSHSGSRDTKQLTHKHFINKNNSVINGERNKRGKMVTIGASLQKWTRFVLWQRFS